MAEEGMVYSLSVGVSAVLLVICALGSAVFSGLTLGLMTLDVVQLKMLIDQPDKTKQEEVCARYARRVLKVRKDGNYLLVTLLLGNVAFNSGFTIILGHLVSEVVALVVSVAVITLMGEIVPQAVCARHGLVIGGWVTPFVLLVEWALFPIVKPIAMGLNFVLGEEIGSLYSKKQLKMLVDHHQTTGKILTREEARILHGGLEFAVKSVEESMTPIGSVFGLDIDGRLDYESAAAMLRAGFSRVPIFDRSQKQSIVGLVFVRDLVLMDPESEVTVRTAMAMLGRKVYAVDHDTTLLSLLTDFKKGHTHLAVVRRVVTDTSLDPYYEHVGIITLEDIIEEILQDEIYDEAEVDQRAWDKEEGREELVEKKQQESFISQVAPTSKQAATTSLGSRLARLMGRKKVIDVTANAQQNTKRPDDPIKQTASQEELEICTNKMLGRLRLFDKRRAGKPLDQAEAVAVGLFLVATQPALFAALPQAAVQEMLISLHVETPAAATVLYTRNCTANTAVLILQGKVKVISGQESFECHLGPWSMLGITSIGVPSAADLTTARAAITSTAVATHRTSAGGLSNAVTAEECSLETDDDEIEQMQVMRKLEQSVCVWYEPDFSASVLEPGTRLLRITQDAYLRTLKAALLSKSPDSLLLTSPPLYSSHRLAGGQTGCSSPTAQQQQGGGDVRVHIS
eukprot:GHVS01003160.1.p1 GENE.GHVS01003160.1~~GHVS01003160.1.p1  ORF type:complete len:684 (+),score=130.18 GHVS01003160.1:456-2507(+)